MQGRKRHARNLSVEPERRSDLMADCRFYPQIPLKNHIDQHLFPLTLPDCAMKTSIAARPWRC